MFIPLNIVSEYTLLSSMIRIKDLITFLKEKKLGGALLLDDNLNGVMEFYKGMMAVGLKALVGLRVLIDGYEVHLVAKNYIGYLNLLKIHTLKEKALLTKSSIEPYLEDIKIILPYASYECLDMFQESYLGYSNDTEKIEASFKTDKIVYTRKALALRSEDTGYLKYLEAIRRGVVVRDVTSDYHYSYLNLNVKDEDKKTTEEFSKDILLILPQNKRYIPKFLEQGESFQYLKALAHKGLLKRLKGIRNAEYEARLNYELDVINKMGFVDYFLIVYDYVLYAKKNDILVGPGRGSAAGSLVSFCLGITDVDPIKYKLLFERFLNPERVTMPDIDIDFEYTKRGKVIDYVREKYGKDKVAPIMTFGTLGAKQVIRDVARVKEIDSTVVDRFVKYINPKSDLKENMSNEVIKNYLNNYRELKEIYDIAFKLEGIKRHISTHAAGVVISSVPIDTVIPIVYQGEDIMTGVTMEYLEELGLLKMDFLALRNLTIIANVLELIKVNTGKMVDLNKINLDDKFVLELFSRGDTEGIFQYESSGMRNLMMKMKPSSFSDLVAAVALFRPGPMGNIDSFIARKEGREKIDYIHPDLEGILKETYGIIVYQEQVMQILVKIGGYSYAEADNIRRAMSKKKEDVMIKDKEHFINNAVKRGENIEIAIKIYDLILKFASYGFNKAHSVSYALIGYQMAYLKVHAPLYFIMNLLNMSIGSDVKTKEYIDEARVKDIAILKPDINISKEVYVLDGVRIRLPICSVKGLGEGVTKSILEEREEKGEFKSFLDFVVRVYTKGVNKKIIESLIYGGVLDSLGLSKRTMIENLDVVLNYASLVSNLDEEFVVKPNILDIEEYEEDTLREKEFLSYGFYITNHPVAKYKDKNIVKINSISSYFDKHIRCVVLVEKIKTIKTKKGDNMAFLTCSDETGNMDFVVFPKAYYMMQALKKGDIISVQGRVTKRFDRYQINIDFLEKLKGFVEV